MCPADSETIWRFPKKGLFYQFVCCHLPPQPPKMQGHPVQEEVGVRVGGNPKVKFSDAGEGGSVRSLSVWTILTSACTAAAVQRFLTGALAPQRPPAGRAVVWPTPPVSPSSMKHLKGSVPLPVSITHLQKHVKTGAYEAGRSRDPVTLPHFRLNEFLWRIRTPFRPERR